MHFLETLFGLFVGLIVVVPLYLGIRLFFRWLFFGPTLFSHDPRDMARMSEALDRISRDLERALEAEASEPDSSESKETDKSPEQEQKPKNIIITPEDDLWHIK